MEAFAHSLRISTLDRTRGKREKGGEENPVENKRQVAILYASTTFKLDDVPTKRGEGGREGLRLP